MHISCFSNQYVLKQSNFINHYIGIGSDRAALLNISLEAKRKRRLARGPSLEDNNGFAGGWTVPRESQSSSIENMDSRTQTQAAMIKKVAYT